MGRLSPRHRLRQRNAGSVGDGTYWRQLRRTGDPPDRAGGPRDRDPPRRRAGGRFAGRMPHRRAAGRARAGDDADQAHGGRPDRLHDGDRHTLPLPPFRCGHAGADRDHPRPAEGRLRRADRHQPAARGPRHSRMRAGGDPGCGQGRLPAFHHLPHPDHRSGGAQRRRARGALCRCDDRQPEARAGGNRAPPRPADRLEHRTRHHADHDQARHLRRSAIALRTGLRHGRCGRWR